MEEFPNLARSRPSMAISNEITITCAFCTSTQLTLVQVGGSIYIHMYMHTSSASH